MSSQSPEVSVSVNKGVLTIEDITDEQRRRSALSALRLAGSGLSAAAAAAFLKGTPIEKVFEPGRDVSLVVRVQKQSPEPAAAD